MWRLSQSVWQRSRLPASLWRTQSEAVGQGRVDFVELVVVDLHHQLGIDPESCPRGEPICDLDRIDVRTTHGGKSVTERDRGTRASHHDARLKIQVAGSVVSRAIHD